MPTIVLENVRSAWNVGSIMRSCDALGYDLVLVGYTPRPEGKTLDIIKKTSIGAEQTVNWRHFDHAQEAFVALDDRAHYAIEISPSSYDLLVFCTQGNLNVESYFWFGNEISGVSRVVLDRCQAELHLPMKGSKESLNVSNSVTAFGYVLEYYTLLQNKKLADSYGS